MHLIFRQGPDSSCINQCFKSIIERKKMIKLNVTNLIATSASAKDREEDRESKHILECAGFRQGRKIVVAGFSATAMEGRQCFVRYMEALNGADDFFELYGLEGESEVLIDQ